MGFDYSLQIFNKFFSFFCGFHTKKAKKRLKGRRKNTKKEGKKSHFGFAELTPVRKNSNKFGYSLT